MRRMNKMKYYLVENDFPKFEIDITKINLAEAAKTVSSVDFNIYRADSWITQDNAPLWQKAKKN